MSSTRIVLISLIVLPSIVVSATSEILAQATKKDKTDAPEKMLDATDNKPTSGPSPILFAACIFIPLFGIPLLIINFIPTAIALIREHPKAVSIFFVNFFLGWTIIGWIIALMWSFSAIPHEVNEV